MAARNNTTHSFPTQNLASADDANLAQVLSSTCDAGLYQAIASMKGNAGVSMKEVIVAMAQYFVNNAADDFEENPFSLEYRAPSEDEEVALFAAGGVRALLGNPALLNAADKKAARMASFRVMN